MQLRSFGISIKDDNRPGLYMARTGQGNGGFGVTVKHLDIYIPIDV